MRAAGRASKHRTRRQALGAQQARGHGARGALAGERRARVRQVSGSRCERAGQGWLGGLGAS